MGASGWLVITPVQDSLAQGLQMAKREVFTSGQFQDSFGIVANPERAIAELYAIDLPPDLPAADREDILRSIQEEQEPRRAAINRYMTATDIDQRIEALRMATGFEGTHSVIDIPTVEQLSPVPEIELMARFDCAMPDLEAARCHGPELGSLVQSRGSAVWFEVQNDCEARFWVIVGVSGD
ncbi:MAG: hypothetical protein HC812_15090 [Leptolyngbya sp. RL_3_1]|nr:hypothetical protein [Leptolyngbya sp. RL_3_1]